MRESYLRTRTQHASLMATTHCAITTTVHFVGSVDGFSFGVHGSTDCCALKKAPRCRQTGTGDRVDVVVSGIVMMEDIAMCRTAAIPGML